METSDMVELQAELAKSLSDFSAALATAWSDIINRSGIQQGFGGLLTPQVGWWHPMVFPRRADPALTTTKFRETLNQFMEDLPEVVQSLGDASKIGRVKDRWTESYQRLVRHVLGIPAPSETEQLLEQWRQVLDKLSGKSGRPSGAMPSLVGLPWVGGWPSFPAAENSAEMLRAWTEAWGRMVGGGFPTSGPWATQSYEERAKKAANTQVKFLKSLPAFQEQIAEAAHKSVTKMIAQIGTINLKDLTPQIYRTFLELWSAHQQEAFQELLASQEFQQTLTKTASLAGEAKKNMDSMMSDYSPFGNPILKKNLEALDEKMYNMERRLQLLEREVEDLKRQPKEVVPEGDPE